MKLLYTGKTKDVYECEDERIMLTFKDDMTGVDGVFDPGANAIGLTVDGVGIANLELSAFFFERLAVEGIKTHYISADREKGTMMVEKCQPFGKGLEVISRFKAVGSFYRRYSKYCMEGQDLDNYVEITIKDDDAGDPLITEDALVELGVLSPEEYAALIGQTKIIAESIRCILVEKNLILYDIKLEFGRNPQGEVVLIDEISSGNMRAYKDGEKVEPFDLQKQLLARGNQ